jgi:hypothetical protein
VDEIGVGSDAVDTMCPLRREVPLGLALSGRADLREERSGTAEVSSVLSAMLPCMLARPADGGFMANW